MIFRNYSDVKSYLQVDSCDDFPKTSCVDCAKNVKMAVKTRLKIVQSHKALLEEFLSKCRDDKTCKPEIIKAENCVKNEAKPDASRVALEHSVCSEDANCQNSSSSTSEFSDAGKPVKKFFVLETF